MLFQQLPFYSTLNNLKDLPCLGREIVGKFTTVVSVVHKEQFNIFFVTDEQLLESVGQEMSGLSVVLITNGWHGLVASVSTTNSAINTMGFSPRCLHKSVRNERDLRRLS